jgi:hypothetical protein
LSKNERRDYTHLGPFGQLNFSNDFGVLYLFHFVVGAKMNFGRCDVKKVLSESESQARTAAIPLKTGKKFAFDREPDLPSYRAVVASVTFGAGLFFEAAAHLSLYPFRFPLLQRYIIRQRGITRWHHPSRQLG